MHDLLFQGSIGRIYHCEFRYQMGYGRNREYQWRLDKKRANGAFADIGSHMIDMAHWLVGDITNGSALLGVQPIGMVWMEPKLTPPTIPPFC